jgi:hypothetical protein
MGDDVVGKSSLAGPGSPGTVGEYPPLSLTSDEVVALAMEFDSTFGFFQQLADILKKRREGQSHMMQVAMSLMQSAVLAGIAEGWPTAEAWAGRPGAPELFHSFHNDARRKVFEAADSKPDEAMATISRLILAKS